MIVLDELKRLLPDWYEGIYETDVLMNVEQSLFESLLIQIQTVQSNQYVATADNKTIAIYESMLGINVEAGDTLDIRRFRVLTRLSTQKPYTRRYLEELLSSFGDPATVEVFPNDYRVLITTDFQKPGQMVELDYLIRSIVPANLLINIRNEFGAETGSKSYFAAAMVVTEYVTITQDYNESTAILGTGNQAAAVVITESVTITQDYIENTEIRTVGKQAVGAVVTETVTISNDYNESPEICTTGRHGSAVVITEAIEIH